MCIFILKLTQLANLYYTKLFSYNKKSFAIAFCNIKALNAYRIISLVLIHTGEKTIWKGSINISSTTIL